MFFEWDSAKAEANRLKHGVEFDEARSAFLGDRALVFSDPDHSHFEERYLLLGMSRRLRILVVAHCLRESGQAIRIVSARQATRSESEAYVEGCR